MEDNLFLLPGPVKVHPRILRALAQPAIGHRSSEFQEVLRRLTTGLRYLFQTKQSVFCLTGSATLGMEAVVSNVVAPGDKILILSNGKFGDRFAEIAHYWAGSGAEVVASPMGGPLDLVQAERILDSGGYKAVAAVLNESSTGVRNDAAVLAELCRKHHALLLADGVTAVGGMDVPFDRWGLDACVVGSQKCVGALPGVTMVAVSDAYLKAARPRSLYLDLKTASSKWAEQEVPFTPATHLYLALAEALDLLAEETLEKRIERTRRLARAVRAGLNALQLPLLASDSISSDTVTAVRYPDGVEEKAVRDGLKQEFGVVVAGGQGELKGKIFRVGHMGYAQPRELAAFLACLESVLGRTPHVFPKGASGPAFMDAWTARAPA